MINNKKEIEKFIKDIGTKNFPHTKNATLYDHLLRTGEILELFDLDENVIKAGMCHSLYSTQIFRNTIISVDKRSILQEIIGDEAENLVHIFSLIDRNTLSRDFENKEQYSFLSYIDKSKIILSKKEASQIVHLILANQFDHVTSSNTGYNLSTLGCYLQWKELICDKLFDYLELYSVKDDTKPDNDTDYVRYIAHAGLQVKTKNKTIVVDPWIYPSDFRTPILEGFDPVNKTIDYLIPEPRNNISDLTADIICLTHFHTHHAPLREIKELILQKPVTIICPVLSEQKLIAIKAKIGDFLFKRITFKFILKDEDLHFDNILIKCLTHTHKEHFSFFIKTKNTSVLHLADASINEDSERNTISETYTKFFNLRPDFLFIGTASHNFKIIKKNMVERDIIENTTFTPIQAAKLAVKIRPKNVATVGIYNHSIWDSRLEGVLSSSESESLFYWAMDFLAPSVKVHKLHPGQIFCARNGGEI